MQVGAPYLGILPFGRRFWDGLGCVLCTLADVTHLRLLLLLLLLGLFGQPVELLLAHAQLKVSVFLSGVRERNRTVKKCLIG